MMTPQWQAIRGDLKAKELQLDPPRWGGRFRRRPQFVTGAYARALLCVSCETMPVVA